MTIAELFVKLSVKGGKESKKELDDTSKGLKGIKDMSLEAKAALLGAVYGLEQMMKQSMERGTGMVQFAAATGMSVEKLGALENAFRQFGVSSGETEEVLKNVQSRMADIAMGKGASGEFMQFAQRMKIDFNRLTDVPYMLQKFTEFAPKVKPEFLRNLMNPLGFSDNFVQMAIRNARSKRPVNFEGVHGGNIYSNSEAESLNRANIAWDNLHDKVNKAFGRFFAGHGQKIVSDLSNITNSVMSLSEALIKLSDKLELFDRFSGMLTGIGNLVSVFAGVVDKMEGGSGDFKMVNDKGETKSFNMFNSKENIAKPKSVLNGNIVPVNRNSSAPPIVAPGQTVNNTVNIHAQSENPREMGDHAMKGVIKATKKQLPSNGVHS